MSTAGSTAVALLEEAYHAATLYAPDLPPVAFTIKASGRKRNSVTLGHFAPGRYTSDGAPLHEICVTGDTIARGAACLLTTVLHEAAHALAKARGIKDTSRQNRYHNTRFVDLAKSLHLTYDLPENYRTIYERPRKRGETLDTYRSSVKAVTKLVPDEAIGWSNVGLSTEGYARWSGVIADLDARFPFDLGSGEVPTRKPRRVTHGYYLPLSPAGRPEALVQIAPSRYRALEDFLSPGVYCESTADEDLVLHVLADHYVTIPGKTPSGGYRYELSDIRHDHPELIHLVEEIPSYA